MTRIGKTVLLGLMFTAAGCHDDTDPNQADTTVVADTTVTIDTNLSDSTSTDATDSSELGDTTIEEDTTRPVDTYVPMPGEFGFECDENDDCNSGWCLQTSQGRRCSRTCVDECPEFYDCREAPGVDATFICVQRFKNLCDPCNETVDCNGEGQAGNFCLTYGDTGSFCGGACTDDLSCPIGYVCRTVPVGGGAEADQCVPSGGGQCQCSPLATSLQLSTTCSQRNDNGECEGTRTCTSQGLNLCDAAEPFPESCNGVDDNCNDQVDEFAPDYVCEIENEFGTCPGQGTCTDGVEECVGEAPKPELCNGLDDDCDGETDEDLCDDGNVCTTDFCNSEGECENVADDTQLCDDGNVCSQVDKCEDGVCTGFNPLSCGDGNPCLDWDCDPTVGCLFEQNTSSCEDGDPCTSDDSCSQGVCVAGSPTNCDDGNPCTVDTCQAGVGCITVNAANGSQCGDADACSIGTCSNGICVGTPINEGQGCQKGGLGQCQEGRCQGGVCGTANKADGSGCTASSSECPQGQCQGGSCFSTSGVSCSTTIDVDLCNDVDVNGVCAASGDCNVQQAPPGLTCPGCNGICIQCFIQFCIPFN